MGCRLELLARNLLKTHPGQAHFARRISRLASVPGHDRKESELLAINQRIK
jgi:hypothetical protein